MLRFAPWIALAAGLVSATGFAPLNWWPVLLASLALLLWLVHEAPTQRSALLRSWLWGVGHFTVGNNWIQHAFDFQDKMPPVLGYFAVVLLALYLAIYPAMAMGLAWRFGREPLGKPGAAFILIAAAAWIVTEWLRGGMFTGYPWNPLGVAWLPIANLAYGAALIGTYAMSGMMVLAAGALLVAVHRDFRPAVATAVVLAGFAAAGIAAAPRASEPPARLVRVVQPNIGQEAVGEPDYPEIVLNRLIALTGRPAPGAPPRLVLWPEGMVNYYIEDGYPWRWYGEADPRLIRARIAASLGPDDLALIGGNALFFDADDKLTGAGNSVWPIDAAGMLGARYDKAHLVPYGEYLPLRPILQPLGLARLVMGDIDYRPGPGPGTLNVPGFGKAGIQVCYEIIFSGAVVDARNRPDFLFNPSNDAWFGDWGPPQHLAQARLRATEEGLPILRSTPTGISAVIGAGGELVATIAPGVAQVIEVPLPVPRPPTPFARLGNWLVFLVAGLLLLIAVAIRRRAS